MLSSHSVSRTGQLCVTAVARRFKMSFYILLILLSFSTTSCGVATVLTELGRENLSFSVLAVNLQLLEETYGGRHLKWTERYGRIADWMVKAKTTPDVIALQEVVGQSGGAGPYATLFQIISQIKQKTNVSYRIAYLSAEPTPQGLLPTLWAGRALLYNPTRMTNTTSSEGLTPARWDDESILSIHPRKSLPCPKESPGFQEFCALLDTEGISWISSARRPSDNRWRTGPAFARMLLKNGGNVNIYNLHRNEPTTFYMKQFEDLSGDMESRFSSNRLYPPLVLGDFNLGPTDVLSFFKDYEIAGYARREVMGVLMGDSSKFSAKQKGHFRETVVPKDEQDPAVPEVSCGNFEELWSDHCGIYVVVSPIP